MRVTTAQTVIGPKEIRAVLKTLRKNWVTPGEKVREFEKGMAKLFGKKYGIMVNSGSSANLLALYAIKKPGVEVITPALTFGTTLAPILQNGMSPKFFDSELETYQIDVSAVERYLKKTPSRERIFMIPALIGNLPNMEQLRRLSKKHKIFFILDSCDTNGAHWNGKPIGAYADMVTSSFYSTHIITAAGGGGIIFTDDKEMDKRLRALRGWGRASAATGESEKIEDRFNYEIDGIPFDKKLAFIECGFNVQPIEIQGAFGVEQMKKLPAFIKIRQKNFQKLYKYFKSKSQFIMVPRQYPQTSTAWINYPVTLTPGCPFNREKLVFFLEKNDIQTRPLFSGNITRHPAFKKILGKSTPFKNADYTMRNSFLIGCHQSLTQKHFNYVFKKFDKFLKENA